MGGTNSAQPLSLWQKPLDVKTAHILDRSKFPGVSLFENRHLQPRGANVPGFNVLWFLSGDLLKIDDAAVRMGYKDAVKLTFGFLLPTIYGGVHLSAWNFEFPSVVEGVLWKAACIYTATAAYAFTIVFVIVNFFFKIALQRRARDAVNLIGGKILGRITLYGITLCRIYIVVEAFVSLRAVPIGVYLTPAWIQMVPHV